jgi:hypothetical protein
VRAAPPFGVRQVGQVGTVRFPRVDDGHAGGATGVEQAADHRHDRGNPAHVVAERLAEPPGLDEIALHVDDDQRSVLERQVEIARIRIDDRHVFASHWQSRPCRARLQEVAPPNRHSPSRRGSQAGGARRVPNGADRASARPGAR